MCTLFHLCARLQILHTIAKVVKLSYLTTDKWKASNLLTKRHFALQRWDDKDHLDNDQGQGSSFLKPIWMYLLQLQLAEFLGFRGSRCWYTPADLSEACTESCILIATFFSKGDFLFRIPVIIIAVRFLPACQLRLWTSIGSCSGMYIEDSQQDPRCAIQKWLLWISLAAHFPVPGSRHQVLWLGSWASRCYRRQGHSGCRRSHLEVSNQDWSSICSCFSVDVKMCRTFACLECGHFAPFIGTCGAPFTK